MDSTPIEHEFLIAEFNALQERAIHLENLKASRVNFLLIIFAATIAALPTIFDRFPGHAVEAIFAIAFVAFVIGLTSLYQVVYYSVSSVVFYRRAGRIRRWYIQQVPSIASYVAFLPRDDRPAMRLKGTYLLLRGADGVLLALNAVLIGTMIACLLLIFVPVAQLGAILWGAAAASILAWIVQWYWVRDVMRRESARQTSEIHFPASDQLRRRYQGKGPGYND